MPLQDVTNDPSMIDWLRQSGHAHLLDGQLYNTKATISALPSGNAPFEQTVLSPKYPPSSTSLPSPPSNFDNGQYTGNRQVDAFHQSTSFPQTDTHGSTAYDGIFPSSLSSRLPVSNHFNASTYDHPPSPLHFSSSPTQFASSDNDQQQLDIDIEVKYLLYLNFEQ